MSDDMISPALVTALSNMDELRRDKTANVPTKAGGSYSYSYTDLASVLGYVRPILAANDIAVMQPASTDTTGAVAVTTILLHRSGQTREFPSLTMPSGRSPQEIGSAITYARRYSLLSALGLATEDDDGKAASKTAVTKKAPAKSPPKRPDGPTEAQTKKVMALFNEAGITDRDARLAYTSAVIGHDIDSWNEVTADEAHDVIEVLLGENARDAEAP